MDKQTVDFYVQVKDGVAEKIGRSVINTPKIVFKGGAGIKWFEDKVKKSPTVNVVGDDNVLLSEC